jgi:CheY-like chemotaxis protein
MLRNSLKEKEQFEELEYIISAGKFLSFIVNDVLDLTHLTNPNPYEIELKCDGFNIYTLIDNIAKIQSIEADHKQIQVKTIISGELPKILYADERRLEQILMKLLARSIEVAPSNGIVELIIEQKIIHHSKGVLLRFSVKDQSEGLSSDEEISELFKPYAKTNSSIGSRFHAQGLSMALVQAIIKVMGGRLVVEKVERNSTSSIKRKSNTNKNNNHVWFEIWLLTEETKDRGRLLRESYDSLAISKNGSAGRNSFKISSAPGSTDGKMMDDTVIYSDNEDTSHSHLRNRKSVPSKPKRDSNSYMTIRKKRKSTPIATTSSATNNGGEDSNDEEVGNVKNVTEHSMSAAANFFRKGSMMLASGLGRASSTIEKPSSSPLSTSFSQIAANEDSIHRSSDKNIASSVQMESQESAPLPIISYYSAGNTNGSPGSPGSPVPPVPPIPPLIQDHNSLLRNNTRKSGSIKSKNSSNASLTTSTNVNTSQNMTTSPHDTPSPTSSLYQHSLHITLPNNKLPLTPPLSSHDARPPTLTSTADANDINSIVNNSSNDNDKKPSTLENPTNTQVNAVANVANIAEKPKKLKVLLVEDNLVCQRVTYKMLNRNNYLVDIANHGKEAVDMVEAVQQQQQQQQYACILMDIITPVMNGYEATQILRDRGVKIPILALTANSFGSDVKKAKEVGMDDFLTKPIKEVVCKKD